MFHPFKVRIFEEKKTVLRFCRGVSKFDFQQHYILHYILHDAFSYHSTAFAQSISIKNFILIFFGDNQAIFFCVLAEKNHIFFRFSRLLVSGLDLNLSQSVQWLSQIYPTTISELNEKSWSTSNLARSFAGFNEWWSLNEYSRSRSHPQLNSNFIHTSRHSNICSSTK